MKAPNEYLDKWEKSNFRGMPPKEFGDYLESEGYKPRPQKKTSHLTYKKPGAPSLITVTTTRKELSPGFVRTKVRTVEREKSNE